MFEAHFQSFEDRGEKGAIAPRLAALRAELKQRGLDGFIVPRADRYQNEYVPPCAERLAWLTGFNGSAGLAIVLADRAVIFVDGRYLVQVRDEVDTSAFTVDHLIEHPPAQWIEENLSAGAKLGYSPWLHTVDGAERLAKACEAAKASLVAVADNLIDSAWADRPAPPLGAVVLHDLRYAGEEASSKLKRVGADLEKITADALIVSDPQSVSWLFNIRGHDVPHTPVVLASAIVPKAGRPALYIDPRKLSNDVRHRLEELADVRANADFERDLAALGKAQRAVRLDPGICPEAIAKLIADNGGKIVRGGDPIVPMKA
ncbi:MAG: aminopeptidase P family N-terminal domain-containing protein, partial [Xanthobacteraceae bacterium]